MVMFKTIAVTISAAAFVTLGIALGPNVPDALATARAMIVTKDDVKLAEAAPIRFSSKLELCRSS
jgi:hypothetical protein